MRAYFEGRGRIRYETLGLPYNLAVGLRESVAAALARLDQEIAAADQRTNL